MSDFIWLDRPLHKNNFGKLDVVSLDTVKLSFDGSIMAVQKNLVEDRYLENDVQMIKAGYKKMPKDLKVETEEELYNFLSYYVTI